MIKTTLNTILLFLAAALIPIGSFILPVYKIKNMPKLSSKDRVVSNIISGGVIYYIDSKLFFIYIGIFLLLEGLYYVFERTNIKTFDRILISTIATTAVGYLLMRGLVGTPSEFIQIMENIYKEYLSVDIATLGTIMSYIKGHLLFIMFTYLLVINYLTYFILKGKSYRKWDISYLWVIIYIGTFFMGKTLKIENFYITNLYDISSLIYVIYGVKVLYSMFRTKLKWRIYGKVLAILTACFFPIVIFLLGVLNSFKIIKIEIKRK